MNNIRSEIGWLVDKILFYRRIRESYMERLALKVLYQEIHRPTIDLRPLPPEQPHPFPPPGIYGDDVITD